MKELGIVVRSGEAFEGNIEFEVKALNEEVYDDLLKYEIHGFRIIADVVCVGFEKLCELRESEEVFGFVEDKNKIVTIFKFIEDVVVVIAVMSLNNLVNMKGLLKNAEFEND
ncbi:MAG: hypothetical protein ACOCRO_07495 [Halanaerobiales bacterium]